MDPIATDLVTQAEIYLARACGEGMDEADYDARVSTKRDGVDALRSIAASQLAIARMVTRQEFRLTETEKVRGGLSED